MINRWTLSIDIYFDSKNIFKIYLENENNLDSHEIVVKQVKNDKK